MSQEINGSKQPLLLHLEKARPRGKNEDPRWADRRRPSPASDACEAQATPAASSLSPLHRGLGLGGPCPEDSLHRDRRRPLRLSASEAMHVISPKLSTSLSRGQPGPFLADIGGQAQRGDVSCPRSYSRPVVDRGLQPGPSEGHTPPWLPLEPRGALHLRKQP